MIVRLMTPTDHTAVYALWLRTPGMGLKDLDDGPEGFCRFLKRNPSTCFVAEKEGVIVGALMAGHDGRRGSMHHLAVDAAHRNLGIGTALVDAAMAALEEEGIHKVNLVVFARNDLGNAFWEARGFSRRDDIVIRDKLIHEMVRMDT